MSTATRSRSQASGLVRAVNFGLAGGLFLVLISMMGMMEAFALRQIIDGVISLPTLLLFITFFLLAYLATGGTASSAQAGMLVLEGALTGLAAAFLTVLLVFLLTAIPSLRTIFINTSPALLKILTFGLDLGPAVAVLLVAGAGLGVLAVLFHLLPPVARRSLFVSLGAVMLIGVLQELIKITLQNMKAVEQFSGLVFTNNGLTIGGAVGLFVVFLVGYLAWQLRGNQVRAGYRRLPPTQRRVISGAGLLLALAFLLALPSLLGLFFSEVLVNTGLYILMGLGLNIVVGFAGLLDLGYVAFFAIGAYTVAVFSSPEVVFHINFPFWGALPFAVIVAVFAGIVLGIPVLKIRGDYLAIVTLGFGEIIRLFAQSDLLKPYIGGGQGLHEIPKPFIGSFEFANSQQLYYLILIGCILVAFIAVRVKNSRLGRAWMAVREDEDVAQAMGINLVTTKLLAFAMGASFGGLGGAFFASKLATIYPVSFNLLLSINVLALIIIGGMGSIPGVIVGALVLVGLPELLREFADFRLWLYGALLVVMMLIKPEGLWPESRRQRELHESEEPTGADGPTTPVDEIPRPEPKPSAAG